MKAKRDVHDAFIDRARDVVLRRCPSTLKLVGIPVADILIGVAAPCPLRSLLFAGDIGYLEAAVDCVVSLRAVLCRLNFISYECPPPSTGISTLSYVSCVTSILSPLPSRRPFHTMSVFLRVPVQNLFGGRHTIHRVGIDLRQEDPDISTITFYPLLRGNFI